VATVGTLAEIGLFAGLSERERRRVGTLVTPVRVEEGRVLTSEGAPGREFIVISEGCATVSRGGHRISQLGPGDFFGELSLVTGIPRTATVTADSDMVVNALNPREFRTLLDVNSALAKKILMSAVCRLADLEGSAAR